MKVETGLNIGINKLANFVYFPNWHQPYQFFDLIINQSKWNSFTKLQKTYLQTTCYDNLMLGQALSDASHIDILKQLSNKGIIINTWPTEIILKLKRSWRQVAHEESLKDNDFLKTYRSLKRFDEEYSIWHDLNK